MDAPNLAPTPIRLAEPVAPELRTLARALEHVTAYHALEARRDARSDMERRLDWLETLLEHRPFGLGRRRRYVRALRGARAARHRAGRVGDPAPRAWRRAAGANVILGLAFSAPANGPWSAARIAPMLWPCPLRR
jgi:hypothetical protein